jgi:hypothetical protein
MNFPPRIAERTATGAQATAAATPACVRVCELAVRNKSRKMCGRMRVDWSDSKELLRSDLFNRSVSNL